MNEWKCFPLFIVLLEIYVVIGGWFFWLEGWTVPPEQTHLDHAHSIGDNEWFEFECRLRRVQKTKVVTHIYLPDESCDFSVQCLKLLLVIVSVVYSTSMLPLFLQIKIYTFSNQAYIQNATYPEVKISTFIIKVKHFYDKKRSKKVIFRMQSTSNIHI